MLVKVPLAFVTEYSRLRAVWNQHIIDHAKLDQKGRRKLEYIYNRQDRKLQQKRDEQKKQRTLTARSDIGLANQAPSQRNRRSSDIEMACTDEK